jgi:uncharacterized protein (TIGR00255 family)
MSVVRSMTGYARVRRAPPQGDLVLSVKSVNHRALDVHCHLPPEFEPFENKLRGVVKRAVARGHVEVRATLAKSGEAGRPVLNRELLAAYLAAFRAAREEFSVEGQPDLNTAFRLPGMLGETSVEGDAGLEAEVTAALEGALKLFNEFREREGAELASAMRAAAARITAGAVAMEKIRERAAPLFQTRLTERLGNLLGGAGVEPQRLAQEAAILADRSDIAEELARLKIHSGQLDDLLAAGGEIGKKLDFLLQEMNRETNTILSKTSGLGETGLTVTDLALAVKADIEKIREQALNLE